ncbi:MAG: response regulator [Terriglobia bacterium]
MTRTVLIADDNLTIQRMAAEMLSQHDVEVVTVANGVAAIKKLPMVKPLVVLADADMPGKDGYEVCSFVKSSPGFGHVRAFLVVGDEQPYDEARGADARVDGVIKKPFDRELLVAIVIESLRQAAMVAPPEVEDAEPAIPTEIASTPAQDELPPEPSTEVTPPPDRPEERFPEPTDEPVFLSESETETLATDETIMPPAEITLSAEPETSIDRDLVASVVNKVVERMSPSAFSPEMIRELERTLTAEILFELSPNPAQS